MHVSVDILENMDSADHFEKEVSCTMTQLAEILEGASDTVFQVQFHKKTTEQAVIQSLTSSSAAKKDTAEQKTLIKGIIEGELCQMTCHLVEAENMLGRSTVIDLNAKGENKFR